MKNKEHFYVGSNLIEETLSDGLGAAVAPPAEELSKERDNKFDSFVCRDR